MAAYKAPSVVKMQAAFHHRLPLAFAALLLLLPSCQKEDAATHFAHVTDAVNAANRQLADGQVAPAIAALEALQAANPGRYDIVEDLAYAQSHAGQPAKAAALFATAAANDSTRRALYIYAAGLDATANNHSGAVQQYHAYLLYFPHDAPAWKSLARELVTLNQTQPALDAYLEAVKASPGGQPAPADAVAIGQLFLQLGNTIQAGTWFHDALQAQPDAATAAQARLGLFALAVQKQDWPAAEKLLADLDADPVTHAALNASPLAATRDQLRQWRAAQDAIQREQDAANAAAAQRAAELAALANSTATTSANPTTPPIVTFASDSSNTTTPSTTKPAVPASNTTTQLATQNPQPVTSLADNSNTPAEPATPPDPLLADAKKAADAGQYPDAIRLYWKVLGKDDSNPDTWLALGQTYLASKQYNDAANVSQEAIRRAPDNAIYTLFYLQVEKASKTPEQYQAELSAASDKFPASADLALDLADAFNQHGDAHDATTVLNNYLRQAPPNDPRRSDIQDALANLPAPKAILP
jgi:tetratricopeptide (TPR) repeat protein